MEQPPFGMKNQPGNCAISAGFQVGGMLKRHLRQTMLTFARCCSEVHIPRWIPLQRLLLDLNIRQGEKRPGTFLQAGIHRRAPHSCSSLPACRAGHSCFSQFLQFGFLPSEMAVANQLHGIEHPGRAHGELCVPEGRVVKARGSCLAGGN